MSRRATVDAAVRAPGATADSVVDSIIAESYAVVSATANLSCSTAAGGASEAQPMASAKTMQDALQHASFRELTTTLDGLTTQPPLIASECALAIRVFVCGTVSIARMHPALGKVLESRHTL